MHSIPMDLSPRTSFFIIQERESLFFCPHCIAEHGVHFPHTTKHTNTHTHRHTNTHTTHIFFFCQFPLVLLGPRREQHLASEPIIAFSLPHGKTGKNLYIYQTTTKAIGWFFSFFSPRPRSQALNGARQGEAGLDMHCVFLRNGRTYEQTDGSLIV